MRCLCSSSLLSPLGAMLVFFLAASAARADIAAPDPVTAWGREDVPTLNVIISIGLAISALVVGLGLALARFTELGTSVAVRASGAVLALVWIVVGLMMWRAEADRGLWAQWEAEEGKRQSNWRERRRFEEPLPEAAAVPPTLPDQDPTKVISPGDLEKLRREFPLDPAPAEEPPK